MTWPPINPNIGISLHRITLRPIVFVFGSRALHIKDMLRIANLNKARLNALTPIYCIADCTATYFPDGEFFFQCHSDIKDRNITLIQSTSPPANDAIIELLIMVDTLRACSPKSIHLVIPYFGYARQDRFTAKGAPVSAKVVANFIGKSGIDHLTLIDLHNLECDDYFDVPVTHLSALPFFSRILLDDFDLQNTVIVSPDKGGLKRAEQLAALTRLEVVCMTKKRDAFGRIHSIEIVGDVTGKKCVIIDDIIDSGETLAAAAKKLIERGAISVIAFATHAAFVTHAVFRGQFDANLNEPSIQAVFVTDTIYHSAVHPAVVHPKVTLLSIETILLDALLCD